ncbi:Tetratricopeptide (plasmid) [Nostoc flagelliforme CCNUN1]|uniref:Tetratricopeptide n=1 Tax=Nostoc flagelliforme CCNUN1 TaxID=2038116 RepID=A0A2K8T5F3_9NOSO|nr:Tetratricopeptide [Nostoc flagelliforme CCNUN1]AUB43146.1 Tetratricopeptide [Nostoc flagelliforme CCNUN1]
MIADLQKAANLFQEQGNTDDYQKVMELLKKFQQPLVQENIFAV